MRLWDQNLGNVIYIYNDFFFNYMVYTPLIHCVQVKDNMDLIGYIFSHTYLYTTQQSFSRQIEEKLTAYSSIHMLNWSNRYQNSALRPIAY